MLDQCHILETNWFQEIDANVLRAINIQKIKIKTFHCYSKRWAKNSATTIENFSKKTAPSKEYIFIFKYSQEKTVTVYTKNQEIAVLFKLIH